MRIIDLVADAVTLNTLVRKAKLWKVVNSAITVVGMLVIETATIVLEAEEAILHLGT